ncbi:dihydrofolate reductase [Spiroplasma platyhelix]|uniref:dihydrofolate reductase n=1 Tax=Spiroplasma platyhelix PALS-1 TaxID=1276218 RepID=A0A846U167_9MOLU|nr:dihydrofolate reductase [Spiroplasma platyhelix]MBE4703876.1 Dihydrofolate reductase [Spiroplasma platyhelix PALS-1]NKE38249.1 dihydrofolate reductase [Spiroplasma platyhelix PALS-1]UJB29134.1 dihydrofolate reductase [Spiroplasma platyhelix PALS-1]
MIYLIWAMTKAGVIANNQTLPWNIKEEMKYFQSLTQSKTILMGSKTLLSIGKPLNNRHNIVITSDPKKYQNFASEYCIITSDLTNIIKTYTKNPNNELWVIGGANIYQQTFLSADYLYVSIIKEDYPGNLKFPITDFSDFKEIKKTEYQEFTAYVYQRKE